MFRFVCHAAVRAVVTAAFLLLASKTSAARFEIDFQKTHGLIRPLHGVNSGPLCYRGTVDLSAYHRELGIPLTRLHDVPWLNAEAVDIHTVFPDFRADPEQAANYRFAPTDDYIAAITNVQSQIVYRLGESIEHTRRKYFVNPPTDPDKWAAICIGIIRHYNEGWAGGFRHGIRYWEIWNEPDVRPAMWTGNDEQFFRLYEVTAKRIKERFPNIQVGGPAVGGTGEFKSGRSLRSDRESLRAPPRSLPQDFKAAAFLTNFLAYCRTREVPLDFLSWHRYTDDAWDLPERAKAMRRLLDDYGFTHCESHLNEWNYLPHNDWGPMLRQGQGELRERWYSEMAGPTGAAFAACALTLFQDAPIDAANFYTGEIQGFGLFTLAGVPKSNYYAFKAFQQMLSTPRRVEGRGSIAGEVTVLAGLNATSTRAAVLISRLKPAADPDEILFVGQPWSAPAQFEELRLDPTHQLVQVATGALEPGKAALRLSAPAPSVTLIKLHAPDR